MSSGYIVQAAVDTVLSQLRNEIAEYTKRATESLQAGEVKDAVHELTVLAEDAASASRALQEAMILQHGVDVGKYVVCETCGTVYSVKYGRRCTCDG
jgi:hypothetical protein